MSWRHMAAQGGNQWWAPRHPAQGQHGGAAVSVLHHLNSLEESADETEVGA